MTERRARGRTPADLPLFAHRPPKLRAPRRGARSRRQLRCWIGSLAAGIAALAATIAHRPCPLLLWNASASAPIGLYRIAAPTSPIRGDLVAAWPPPPARELAAQRHYLPRNVPLVKRVAAVAGDRVCARGRPLTIAGKVVALRRARDAMGRAMPAWHGCVTLGRGTVLLLNDASASFDGRYFGPSDTAAIVGRAIPLWLR